MWSSTRLTCCDSLESHRHMRMKRSLFLLSPSLSVHVSHRKYCGSTKATCCAKLAFKRSHPMASMSPLLAKRSKAIQQPSQTDKLQHPHRNKGECIQLQCSSSGSTVLSAVCSGLARCCPPSGEGH